MGVLTQSAIARNNLRFQKESRDLELQSKGFTNNNGTLEVIPGSAAEAQQRQAQFTSDKQAEFVKSLENENDASKTDGAFVDYVSSGGDIRTLERMFNERPRVKQLFNKEFGVETISNIDFENDTQMLDNAGIAPKYYSTLENRKKIKGLLLKYHNGSDWQIANVGDLAKNMGTFRRARYAEQEVIKDQIQEVQNLFLGGGEEQALAERKQAFAERKQEFTETQAGVTTTQKDVAASIQQKDKLYERAGGREKFLALDFEDEEVRSGYQSVMEARKTLTEQKLSNTAKVYMQDTASSLSLGAKISTITDADVGFVQNQTDEFFKKSVGSENTSKAEKRTAKKLFDALVVKSLSGAGVSDEEYKRLSGLLGSLSYKKSVGLLAQFGTVLQSMKAKFDTIYRSLPEDIAHYDYGGAKKKYSLILSTINHSINIVQDRRRSTKEDRYYKTIKGTKQSSDIQRSIFKATYSSAEHDLEIDSRLKGIPVTQKMWEDKLLLDAVVQGFPRKEMEDMLRSNHTDVANPFVSDNSDQPQPTGVEQPKQAAIARIRAIRGK
jgi:hypothetical protein